MAIAIYAVVGIALLGAALMMTGGDASSRVGCVVFPALIIYGIAGGWFFVSPSTDDDSCARYSSFMNDC